MGTKTEEDRHRAKHITFRCSQETEDTISKLAAERRFTKSEVMRELVDKGLVAVGCKQDEDAQYELVKAALKDILTPQVERLATINAKATQISGAAFFLLTYVMRLYFPEDERDTLDEVAAQARQLGIEYLKLRRGSDIDSFIRDGINKMDDGGMGASG